jgi:hypothetical protein
MGSDYPTFQTQDKTCILSCKTTEQLIEPAEADQFSPPFLFHLKVNPHDGEFGYTTRHYIKIIAVINNLYA